MSETAIYTLLARVVRSDGEGRRLLLEIGRQVEELLRHDRLRGLG